MSSLNAIEQQSPVQDPIFYEGSPFPFVILPFLSLSDCRRISCVSKELYIQENLICGKRWQDLTKGFSGVEGEKVKAKAFRVAEAVNRHFWPYVFIPENPFSQPSIPSTLPLERYMACTRFIENPSVDQDIFKAAFIHAFRSASVEGCEFILQFITPDESCVKACLDVKEGSLNLSVIKLLFDKVTIPIEARTDMVLHATMEDRIDLIDFCVKKEIVHNDFLIYCFYLSCLMCRYEAFHFFLDNIPINDESLAMALAHASGRGNLEALKILMERYGFTEEQLLGAFTCALLTGKQHINNYLERYLNDSEVLNELFLYGGEEFNRNLVRLFLRSPNVDVMHIANVFTEVVSRGEIVAIQAFLNSGDLDEVVIRETFLKAVVRGQAEVVELFLISEDLTNVMAEALVLAERGISARVQVLLLENS